MICFLCPRARSASPTYGLIILNRKDLNNLVQPLTQHVEFHLNTPFLLYKKLSEDLEDGERLLSLYHFFQGFAAPKKGGRGMVVSWALVGSTNLFLKFFGYFLEDGEISFRLFQRSAAPRGSRGFLALGVSTNLVLCDLYLFTRGW